MLVPRKSASGRSFLRHPLIAGAVVPVVSLEGDNALELELCSVAGGPVGGIIQVLFLLAPALPCSGGSFDIVAVVVSLM